MHTIIQPPKLPPLRGDMHKGDAGRVLIAGGGRGMLGAAMLAGEAALRCGGGAVTIATAAENVDLPAVRCAELMSADALQIDARAEVVVLGPGLGLGEWGAQVFARFIQSNKLVVDADALNLLARNSAAAKLQNHHRELILTPHAGEAARLLRCSAADIQADRAAAARAIAADLGGVCILKGAATLVATAAGEVLQCDRGNPGMATAGMGDVLAGMLGGLWGQAMAARDAAAAAVWLHSAAADLAAAKIGERSLMAGDVVAHIAAAITAAAE